LDRIHVVVHCTVKLSEHTHNNMKLSIALTLLIAPTVTGFASHRSSTSSSSMTTNLNLQPGSAGTGEGWIEPSAPVNTEASLKYTLEKSLEGATFQKRLSLLGSTGSIGTQTLDIVDACPDNFVVDALSAGTNSKLMTDQVLKYKPKIASMATAEAAQELKSYLQDAGCTNMPTIMYGEEGILAAATIDSADTVVTGIVGAAGLEPTIEAIKLGKDISLANKETLISGGPVINPLVKKHGINMLPADSEHSAIFQCLQGVPEGGLRRVILTASGGAFRDLTKDELFRMCEDDPRAVQAKATTHPNWDMGAKITLDSATMMNKGLEVSTRNYTEFIWEILFSLICFSLFYYILLNIYTHIVLVFPNTVGH
jgi:1-deoxy-D-xylulose-5-phosphate reductoisomerase